MIDKTYLTELETARVANLEKVQQLLGDIARFLQSQPSEQAPHTTRRLHKYTGYRNGHKITAAVSEKDCIMGAKGWISLKTLWFNEAGSWFAEPCTCLGRIILSCQHGYYTLVDDPDNFIWNPDHQNWLRDLHDQLQSAYIDPEAESVASRIKFLEDLLKAEHLK